MAGSDTENMENPENSQSTPLPDIQELTYYHLMEDDNHEGEIRIGLEKKLDALVLRELYGKSKTALTEEEREKARQEYLDRRGIPNSFRW